VAESVGSLADKLSIVELKIYHMREQADRADASITFRTQCLAKLEVLDEQRRDLSDELTELLADYAAGRRAPKVYRQFKMYNDPQYRAPTTTSPVA
jgi:hypothetical protein